MNRKIKAIIMITAATLFSSYSAYSFSDEYEPIYPQITAVTRSVEDIYLRTTGVEMEKKVPQETLDARREMIKMYKDVGIDVSYDMENVVSTKLRYNMPTRWSTQTPRPLGGDYSGAFSIDAPWNNKIPKDNPRIEIPEVSLSRKFQIGSMSTNAGGSGDGVGFPLIVGDSSMPYQKLYIHGGVIQQIYKLRMPENIVDYLNNRQTGDEHGIFIDGENNVAVEAWKCRAKDDPRGYGTDLALPYAPVRGRFGSCMYRLDGIATEGRTGTNAASIPSLAFTIKPSELQDDSRMIEHALGAALNANVTARVMPAYTTDSHAAGNVAKTGRGSDATYMTGIVPYGGIIQLDPEIDLDAIYESGKLSLPGYKVLKAMQDYGIYNIDTSGGANTLIYTSTTYKDWVRTGDERFNVPYKDGVQGQSYIQQEIRAFVDGDSFFGIEKPKLYCTVPVMKYAELDVNGDDTIDTADYELVSSHNGKEYSESTKIYDVNQDKVHDYRDTEIMYRYLNDLTMHSSDRYNIILEDHDSEGGDVIIGGEGYGALDGSRSFKVGAKVHIAAFPDDGYEFAGWTGDLAEYKEDVVPVTIDREYVVGARFRKIESHNLTVKIVGEGTIQACTGKDQTFGEVKNSYGHESLVVLKAQPAEGWVFAGYEGNIRGFTATAPLFMDSDKEVTVMFVKEAYNEPFKTEEWGMVTDGQMKIVEGNRLEFTSANWSINEAIAVSSNENIDLTGDYMFRAYLYTGYPQNNGGEIIFNYTDRKNYYFFKIGGYGTGATLGKVYNGVKSTLATYSGKTVVDSVLYDGFPITLCVERKNGRFSCYGYKNGGRITYFENIRDKTLDGGTIGVGAINNGILKVNTMVIQKEIPDPSSAVVYVPQKSEDTVRNN